MSEDQKPNEENEPNVILSKDPELAKAGHHPCEVIVMGNERVALPSVEEQERGFYLPDYTLRKVLSCMPQYKRIVKKGE